ncbi:winged helix-turn-helix domain-containing protein [Halobacterium yunchengense]|uniref:winged helix-turn-helix domain-containing protein n=1 Tax=Halobacterium yunchengense TaxID=3108497 RepID=UPI00300AD9FA
MERVLWYLLAGARGGPNRCRILRALRERPRNANRLAEDLDLDYTTVRHHLDLLVEHDLVEDAGDGYGTVYLLADRVDEDWATVEDVIERVN